MALASGSRIGPYEIGAPLGAGGMGQVYRARDTELGRDVAIKALPDALAGDPERVARFQREAQLLASLNHPNIAGIHGLESDGAHKYLVLELVDGVTLGDHIKRSALAGRGLPVKDVLAIARQIIDALEAAHDKGIVHRDLKPANIMLTADGQVKVLDFGLARSVESDSAASQTNSPTFTMAATQAGMILGTAAYMSPEQAKGRIADKRSDVWAFGCVFYELLTGKRLFEAEDVSETLAAVLRAEPEWSALPADVPADVRVLLQRCLERDRRKRIPDFAVVRFLLDERSTAPAGGTSSSSMTGGRSRTAWLIAAFAAGILLTAAGVLIAQRFTPAPEPSRPVRFGIVPTFAQRLAPTIVDRQLAISPDGRYMVYVSGSSSAGGQLMLRAFDQLDALPIVSAAGARSPFFSHDGKWIGYFGATDLRKVALAGGPSSSLCPADGPPRGATWLADDTIVFATAVPTTGLQRVSAGGGTPTTLTTTSVAQGEGDHVFPSALPDGRGILFTILPTTLQAANAQTAALNPDTGERKILVRGASAAQYVAPGYLMYASSGTVSGVRFDAEAWEVHGDPMPILPEAAVIPSGVGQFAVSGSGALVYVPTAMLAATAGGGGDRTLVWINRQGREEAIKGVPPRAYFALRLSPDGTRLALDIRDQENDIWVWSLARSTLTRLTFDPGADLFPIWSHDSLRILFGSARDGSFNIYQQAADGTGSPERLTTAQYGQYAASMVPDGSGMVVYELKASQNPDVALVRLSGQRELTPLLTSPATERVPEISPDGHFIAYESDESARFEIYVRPFPNVNGGKWMISPSGGTKPVWSRAGNELFYTDPNGKLTAVPVQTKPTFTHGNPTPLFDARNIATLSSARHYDVAKDGRFVMIREVPPPPGTTQAPVGPTFVVVMNWVEELKGKGK